MLWVLLHLALLDFAMAGFGASSFHDQVTSAALWQMLSGHGAAFWKLTWCVPCVYIKHVTCVWCWHMLTVWLEIRVFFEWFWMYTWCLHVPSMSMRLKFQALPLTDGSSLTQVQSVRNQIRNALEARPMGDASKFGGFCTSHFWCVIGDGLFLFISFHHRNLNWQWKTTMGETDANRFIFAWHIVD